MIFAVEDGDTETEGSNDPGDDGSPPSSGGGRSHLKVIK